MAIFKPNNVLNQQASGFPPGRVILKREVYRAPLSGRLVEIKHLIVTKEVNGNFVTQDDTQVDPPIDDGTTPQSVSEIVECRRCLGIVTRSLVCPHCGFEYCLPCTEEVEIDGQEKILCKECAAKARFPLYYGLKNTIWGE